MRLATTVLATVFLAACATLPEETALPETERADAIIEANAGRVVEHDNIVKTVLIMTDPAKLLPALQTSYEKHGIKIETLHAPTGLIGNRNFRVSGRLGGKAISTFIKCPMLSTVPNIENTFLINFSVVSTVKKEGTGSTINTTVQVTAKDPHSGQNPYRCDTKGTLEASIAQGAADALGLELISK